MNKITLTAAALAAVLATPAFAQQSPPSSTPTTPPAATSPAPSDSAQSQDQSKGAASEQGGEMKKASTTDQKPGFVQKQSAEEWRASKLIGASVTGPDDKSIGDIDATTLRCEEIPDVVEIGFGLRRDAKAHQRDVGRLAARRLRPRALTSSARAFIDSSVIDRPSP